MRLTPSRARASRSRFPPAGRRPGRGRRSSYGARTSENGPLVSATAYRLTKAYSPGLFVQAAKELDGVVAKLVQASRGTLIESVTTTVDGQRIRAYRFTSHPSGRPSTDDRIGFVLEGRHEYQLLCRAPAGAGDPDSACALLFGSFAARLK